MDKKTYFEVTVQVGEEVPRKAAFAEGVNRGIDFKKVIEISENIKAKGFRKAEVVQVIPAEEMGKEVLITDINGTEVDSDDRKNYYLVLDGQHRVYAASLHNEWLFNETDAPGPIIVPGIIAELVGGESVVEYINEINITKKEWVITDYLRGAANVHPDNNLLQTYKSLIKCDSNPDGFPLSTLNYIFCGDGKGLTKSDLYSLSKGDLRRLKGGKWVESTPPHNLVRGNKFISICRTKGFKEIDITKRYLIQKFRSLATIFSVTTAFKIFEAITPEDKDSMLKKNGFLDPDLMNQRFDVIIERLGLGIKEEDFED